VKVKTFESFFFRCARISVQSVRVAQEHHRSPAPLKSAPSRVLHLLKQGGARDAASLADDLSVTPTAVRQHLAELLRRGLVTFHDERSPLGRPVKVWSTASAAEPCFADRHANLFHSFLDATAERFGENGLAEVVHGCASLQTRDYRERIPREGSLAQKLSNLASLRNEEGFMASLVEETDGSFQLIERHCPIRQAASRCPLFCDAELTLFRDVLGPGVEVERVEHLLGTDQRCCYRIRSTDPTRERNSEETAAPRETSTLPDPELHR